MYALIRPVRISLERCDALIIMMTSPGQAFTVCHLQNSNCHHSPYPSFAFFISLRHSSPLVIGYSPPL